MTHNETSVPHRVLLVDDDEGVRDMMRATLEHKGFDVVPAVNVTGALKLIAAESFDVLITDLHMPNPGDGFAVIAAMRHSYPEALTLLVSGYPDVKSAMEAIVLQADEIIAKPFDMGEVTELLRRKMLTRKADFRTPKGKSRGDIAALHESHRRRVVSAGKKKLATQPRFAHGRGTY